MNWSSGVRVWISWEILRKLVGFALFSTWIIKPSWPFDLRFRPEIGKKSWNQSSRNFQQCEKPWNLHIFIFHVKFVKSIDILLALIVAFTEVLLNSVMVVPCVKIMEILSHIFFYKKYVKAIALLKKLLYRYNWFDERFFRWERNSHHGNINIFFRQISSFIKSVTKEFISRKFFSVIAFCSTFPHTVILFPTFWQKFRESNVFSKKLLMSWFHEIFFRWERISRFFIVWSSMKHNQSQTFSVKWTL